MKTRNTETEKFIRF